MIIAKKTGFFKLSWFYILSFFKGIPHFFKVVGAVIVAIGDSGIFEFIYLLFEASSLVACIGYILYIGISAAIKAHFGLY